MQVALTVWEGRISPLFDSTRKLLVADIKGKKISTKQYIALECDSPFSRAARLGDLGVGILICGGISSDFASLIEAQGIRIIPFATGTVEEVLENYINNNL